MPPDAETLGRELEELRARNRELEQTLDAIRSGEVDAIVVSKGETTRVYALEGADHPYRVLVENIQEGALTLTDDGLILYANAAFAAMRGLPLRAVLGGMLRDHLVPRDRARFDALLAVSRTGPRRGETSLCSGSASVPVRISLTPLAAGDETRISVVVTDRRLDYGRIRLQARMLDSVLDAVTAVDPEGTVIYWNEAAERLYGWTAPEMIGRSLLDMAGPEGPEEGARRALERLAGGEPWSGEFLARHRDGRRFPVRATRSPVYDEDGTLVAVIGTSQDISEQRAAEEALRASEERYRALITASAQALFRMSPDWSEMLEFRGGGFLPDTERPDPFWERRYIHPDDLERVLAAVGEAVRAGTAFELEHRVRRVDGTPGWTQSRAVPVRDAAGEVVEWFGAASDITERMEAEAELARSAEDLRRSNEELQRFAYVASHDLQEPLRPIVSFSQLLERRYRGRLDADADEYIGFIVEGGTRMQMLIRDLLQLSRVETQAKEPVPTEAGGAVAAALRLLQAPIAEAGATVAVGPMPRVRADAAQLEQVFVNLIGNAVKYRRAGAPLEVRVSADRAGALWRFAVADNGIGIEAEYFGRIFEMFRRLHTHDEYEGTGIGLAVVKRIIERHGGTIRVESRPGEGSTFFFTLPAA